MNIYDQLQAVEDRYEELGELLSDPEVVSDTKRFMELSREEANTRETVIAYREYKQVIQNISDAEEMIKEASGDADLEEMAKEELKKSKAAKEEYEERLKILLLPKDPNDDKNIILEIRGAAGGDEAALFAGDLLAMYQKYAETQGWRFEVMEASYNGVGGIKEVVAMVSGESVYSKLKYESGAHRVQRVPVTESQGRVHTSTATVLVMPEVEEMAKEELKKSKAAKEEYEERLKILLLPKDPNDDKNIILEIRGAAGGDEAALFAGDLLAMYQKYAETQGWRFEVMEASYNGVGGIKEVVAMVSGESVYSKLKYESGAHRVQRVPVTESQGRVHTSTATVLVMPEVEEMEYEIDPKDLRVDIYHASGAGGQNVNKVATAVRMVHIPTGIKVEMQEERTQQKNRDKALKIIRARVADHFAQIAQDEQDAERKSTVGTGDRSERIRTYNFPQNRVTDHRIGLTLQKLDTILAGKMDEVIDALVLYDQTQKLEELNK